ncbi:MAG TPA: methyltransferase [Actinopolymorphaceae bacterium]
MLLFCPPGVYKPQADTWLLVEALRNAAVPRGARVLDIGTGTGALSVAAAELGATDITAVDVSLRAAFAAWVNTRRLPRRVPVTIYRGDALDNPQITSRPYDLVLANPPYVPGLHPAPPKRGRARAWDSGVDGRAFLDRLCDRAYALLRPRGTLLLVHSSLCRVDSTTRRLRAAGLKTSIVARRIEPFGPVLRGRLDLLEERGLIRPGQRHEELVVIRGDRPG